LSTLSQSRRKALYYPFHLCHEQTLLRLLDQYDSVHFRDFMALQLTSMAGTTAYTERMGNSYETLVRQGRIVQGYPVSGPLDEEMVHAIDRDLSDSAWRALFHFAFVSDRRFQRGLLDITHGTRIGGTLVPGPAAFLELARESRRETPFSVDSIRDLSQGSTANDGFDYEYGMAVIKTSASLVYTIRLSQQHDLECVTDSEYHFRLLEHTTTRDRVEIVNREIKREGY
jgi:hypothetical protein